MFILRAGYPGVYSEIREYRLRTRAAFKNAGRRFREMGLLVWEIDKPGPILDTLPELVEWLKGKHA